MAKTPKKMSDYSHTCSCDHAAPGCPAGSTCADTHASTCFDADCKHGTYEVPVALQPSGTYTAPVTFEVPTTVPEVTTADCQCAPDDPFCRTPAPPAIEVTITENPELVADTDDLCDDPLRLALDGADAIFASELAALSTPLGACSPAPGVVVSATGEITYTGDTVDAFDTMDLDTINGLLAQIEDTLYDNPSAITGKARADYLTAHDALTMRKVSLEWAGRATEEEKPAEPAAPAATITVDTTEFEASLAEAENSIIVQQINKLQKVHAEITERYHVVNRAGNVHQATFLRAALHAIENDLELLRDGKIPALHVIDDAASVADDRAAWAFAFELALASENMELINRCVSALAPLNAQRKEVWDYDAIGILVRLFSRYGPASPITHDVLGWLEFQLVNSAQHPSLKQNALDRMIQRRDTAMPVLRRIIQLARNAKRPIVPLTPHNTGFTTAAGIVGAVKALIGLTDEDVEAYHEIAYPPTDTAYCTIDPCLDSVDLCADDALTERIAATPPSSDASIARCKQAIELCTGFLRGYEHSLNEVNQRLSDEGITHRERTRLFKEKTHWHGVMNDFAQRIMEWEIILARKLAEGGEEGLIAGDTDGTAAASYVNLTDAPETLNDDGMVMGTEAIVPLSDTERAMTVIVFDRLQRYIHETAVAKGWWDKERNDGEMIALCHAELSEALESLRHGDPPSDHIPDFSGAEEEFADVFVRMLDMCGGRGLRFALALLDKLDFNAGRPYKHGGKLF
jgi:NTP pyrophosphatase (non-canonical NTP hydrolase)